MTFWKPRLKPFAKRSNQPFFPFPSSFLCGFSSAAHITGVSVSATRPDSTTETATVTANCW